MLTSQYAPSGRMIAVLASLFLVGACINPSKSVYQGADVGRMIDTTEATFVSSRIVKIKEESRGYGPLAGAAVGATGTGFATRNSQNAGWAIALGGLVGAGAGLLAEQAGRSREGIEYLVRTSDGRVMTLVQNRGSTEEPIAAGKAVLVQHSGTYTRVIEKPETLEDEWRNPDAQSGGGSSGGGGGSGGAGGGDVQPRGGIPAMPGMGGQTMGGSGFPGPGASRARPEGTGGGSGLGQEQQ
jgi:outer membrane lipoprotein SlyB